MMSSRDILCLNNYQRFVFCFSILVGNPLLTGCSIAKKSSLEGTALLMSLPQGPGNGLMTLQCTPLSVKIVQANNNDSEVLATEDIPITVKVSGMNENQKVIYTDESCTSPGNSSTIAKGSSRTMLYIQGSSPGELSLSVSADSFVSINAVTVRFIEGKISLSLDSALQTSMGPVGNRCQALRIERETEIPDGTIVTLTLADEVGGAFYTSNSGSDCDNTIDTPTSIKVTLKTDTRFNRVFFKPAPQSTSVKISAQAPGVAAITPLSVSVKPIQLGFSLANTSTTSVVVNQCAPVRVCSTLINSDTCIAAGLLKLDLSVSSDSGASLYGDSQCQTQTSTVTIGENGSLSSNFFLKGTIPNQTATLKALALGLTPVTYKVTIGSP